MAEIGARTATLSSSALSAAGAAATPAITTTTTRTITRERKPPRAVVAAELMDDNVPVRNAWVGALREKRDISKAIRIVSTILPGMSHLKRCSGNRLIVAFAAPYENERRDDRYYAVVGDLENFLTTNGFDLSMFKEKLEMVRVPAHPPRTKGQARVASRMWPINFHPDPSIELILNGRWFDNEKMYKIERCMKACIEAASRRSRGNEECNGSALAFDPMKNRIVAVAASSIDRHPMWHASMLVVDLVARLSGGLSNNGGAYELNFSDDEKVDERTTNVGTLSFSARKRKLSQDRRYKRVLEAYPTDLADIVDRYNGPSSSSIAETSGYLCTDYWIFLLREPCPLCAMALLHSRASDIFYGIPNEYRGVLGSRALLHATPGLNHRYHVWQGVYEEECRQTFNQISTRSSSPTFYPFHLV